MTVIAIKYVQVGMVLLHEVRDLSGRLLLGQGEAVTEKHLKIFRAWGVSECDVRGASEQEVPAAFLLPDECRRKPELMAKVEERVNGLFRFAGKDLPLTRELRHYCQVITCQKLLRGD